MQSKMTIDAFGNKRWCNEKRQLHRIDGPACEWADGNKTWWVNDQLHREDGPAIEWMDGHKKWWVRGKLVYELEAGQPYSPAINRLICALYCKIGV